MDSSLDAVDHGILYLLQQDSRTPITTIADELNVSDNTIRNRIRKLESLEVIKGYSILINYDHADIPHYYLFVCTARVGDRDALATRAQDIPGVLEVMSVMTGTGNVHVRAAATTKENITRIAQELDEVGLTVEDEHLIWSCVNKPFTLFETESRKPTPQ